MGKTNSLRKQVKGLLENICENIFYENATTTDLYPHIVFSFSTTDNNDSYMDKVYMDVDIWSKGHSAAEVEDLADKVDNLFRNLNNPTEDILPTYYLADRRIIEDLDRTIRRRLIKIEIQNYESGE